MSFGFFLRMGFQGFFITEEKENGGGGNEKGGEILESEQNVGSEFGQAGLMVVSGVGQKSLGQHQQEEGG